MRSGLKTSRFAGCSPDGHRPGAILPRVSEAAPLLDLAESVAREAGALLLERFRRPATGVDSKSSATDLVSDADRDAEALLRETAARCAARRRRAGRGGVERRGRLGPPLGGGSARRHRQLPVRAARVGGQRRLRGRGRQLVGVVHVPTRDETFTATRGGGARLDGAPIGVSGASELASALIATGFSYVAEVRRAQAAALATILPSVRDIRRGGSAALDLASVACGRVDGFYEVGLKPWDLAAGALLVREAGGLRDARRRRVRPGAPRAAGHARRRRARGGEFATLRSHRRCRLRRPD